jgi:hypothetical protein
MKRARRSGSEFWQPIAFFPGYEISNRGRVRSLKGTRPKILKLQPISRGDRKKSYLRVTLRNKGGQKHRKIHRLVAIAFIPCPPGKNTVDHINGNTTDNAVENLEWTTNVENVRRAWRTGLMKNSVRRKK